MPRFTTRPEILGTFGVVTSTHWLATAAGMSILEKGGNAFDAAVATGFALQLVEPHLNGPAGEVPLILYSAGHEEVKVICGQGTAPAAAGIDTYRRLGLDLVPGNGLLATVVPGAFDAWMLLLRDYGTLGGKNLAAVAEKVIDDPDHPKTVRGNSPLMELGIRVLEWGGMTFTDSIPRGAVEDVQNG